MIKLNSEDVKLLKRIFMLEMVLISCLYSSMFLFIEVIVDAISLLSRYSTYIILMVKSNILSILIYKMTMLQILYQDLKQKQTDRLYCFPIKVMLYVSTLPITVFVINIVLKGINIRWNLIIVLVIYILCFVNSILKSKNYILRKWNNEV